MNNLTKPIIIGAVIIGVCIVGSQYLKQSSIEKQQRLEFQAEEEKEIKAEQDKEAKERSLSLCIRLAEESYWDYMRINGTEKKDGVIWAEDKYWNTAEKNKQNDIDNCYKRYK
jgi:hypothetical protein